MFFDTFAKELKVKTPKVHYTFGDWDTGVKIIIMEDMSDLIQAGFFSVQHRQQDIRQIFKTPRMV